MLMKPSKRQKAQSAMEYLMTYGWAILIIAVVLGALFSLGVFNGKNLLGSACVAESGFYCQNAVYHHGTVGTTAGAGNVMVQIGQNTGTSWTSAMIVFIPQGTPTGTSGVPGTANTFDSFGTAPGAWANNTLVTSGLGSGQQINILLPVNGTGPTVSLGSSTASGTIWAEYCTQGTIGGSCTAQYAEIATLNQKAS